MRQREALYYVMTGETFGGKRAAEIGERSDISFTVDSSDLADIKIAVQHALEELETRLRSGLPSRQ